MVEHAISVTDTGDVLHGKQDASLVIGPHERNHGGVVRDGVFQVGQAQQAIAIYRQVSDAIAILLQGLAVDKHGGVFHGRCDDVPLGRVSLESGVDGRIVALRAAAGEDYPGRASADELGDLATGGFENRLELGSEAIAA